MPFHDRKQALETNRKLLRSFYSRRAPDKKKNVNALIDYYLVKGGESSAPGSGADQLNESLFETYGERLEFVAEEVTPREEDGAQEDEEMLAFLGEMRVAPPPKPKPHVYVLWSAPTFRAEVRSMVAALRPHAADDG